MVRMLRGAICGAFCLLGAAAAAEGTAPAPRLGLPVSCAMDTVCQIQNLFDHDPGPGFQDYRCGNLGYDGHDGTDIRLPNLAVMEQGVAVLAAAAGRVRAIRDAMDDVSVGVIGEAAIRGREGGNGVVLDHGGGWETQYSHMRRGSIGVKPGDSVAAGGALGLIGLSGGTEFPHLHFEVRYQGKPVDPFAGLDRADTCSAGEAPLWDAQTLALLAYRPTGLIQAGFAAEAPRAESLAAGRYAAKSLPPTAPALVFWVELFGARQGDRESLRLTGPDGRLIAEKEGTVPKNKARWLSFAGKKRGDGEWPIGDYKARYRLERHQAGEPAAAIVELERELAIR